MSCPCTVAEGTEFLRGGPGKEHEHRRGHGDGIEPGAGPGPEAELRFSRSLAVAPNSISIDLHAPTLASLITPSGSPPDLDMLFSTDQVPEDSFIKHKFEHPSHTFLNKTRNLSYTALCSLLPPASLASAKPALTQQHTSWSCFHSIPVLSAPQTRVSRRSAVRSATDVSG